MKSVCVKKVSEINSTCIDSAYTVCHAWATHLGYNIE